MHDAGSQIKLPKLVLKSFNGDITKWCSFWDTFEAAIHKNSKVATIDEFNYLNSLLEKTTSDAIAGLAITNANYEEAITILKTRFGNKQMIVNKHMDDLINMAHVYSNHDLRGMRQLYDLVEVHVRGLKALGVPSASYGSLLSSVLMNKVPQEVRLIITREVKGGDWELDRLLTVMHQELEARRELHREITIHNQTHHSEGTGSIGRAHPQPRHYSLSQIANQPVPIANSLMHLVAVRPFLMHKPEEMFLRRPEDVSHVVAVIMSASVRATC